MSGGSKLVSRSRRKNRGIKKKIIKFFAVYHNYSTALVKEEYTHTHIYIYIYI
jgi:hypothetical protein